MTVEFIDAKPGQCRFPLWRGAARTGPVCGEPVERGKSWCPACCRIVYDRTSTARERRAEFLAQRLLARTIQRAGATFEAAE